MTNELQEWEQQLEIILTDLKSQTELNGKHVFVIGCSTSEVIGQKIGTAGTTEVAEMIYKKLTHFSQEVGVTLAFQCCEHLNRALVVERETAESRNWEEVSVIPARTAGGAMATYAFEQFYDPVVVERVKADAGIDIGDTLIGMHLKHVAVPIRASIQQIGNAHVTMAKTRPKLIGGGRAIYERKPETESCS
ncbi:TIGR01440 family protein [Cytobacillus spongiae]|jgi:uncharacterized protein (TIGR01440 family)|uniref:TIGR01440 family protein n=1 Tax=Cytobacillus spongiae TaxID=2901381 RepID=UPI001F2BB434|nr:TIGR01440 family protein [Cytobacillus spongiae]UII55752.1 TIGR01440 family protein [Cytobacillus spongiae]